MRLDLSFVVSDLRFQLQTRESFTNHIKLKGSLVVHKMPSKKKQSSRPSQIHPQAILSDYEDTDTAAPVMEQYRTRPPRTNTELNLAVLTRYLPDIQRIISIAPFAVVYVFSPDTQQWEKSGVEGTLFVCQLAGSPNPRYNVVILNRKSLDNFITELVSDDDIEITEQYVILQVMGEGGVPTIYGLWIFSGEGEGVHSTREIVANSIQECAMRAAHANLAANGEDEEEYVPAPASYDVDDTPEQQPQEDDFIPQPNRSGQPIDLLSLFGKSAPPQGQTEQSHFMPPLDTDFFRSSNNPAANLQAQSRAPSQQNALLSLFKSAT
jgi:hypothetical protein